MLRAQRDSAKQLTQGEQLVVKDKQIRFFTFEFDALKLQILKLRRMPVLPALHFEQLDLLVENQADAAGLLVQVGPPKTGSEGFPNRDASFRRISARHADERVASIMPIRLWWRT